MHRDELESDFWHALTAYDTGRIPADQFIDRLLAQADQYAASRGELVSKTRERPRVTRLRNQRTGKPTPTARRRAVLNERYPPTSLKDWERRAARIKL